MLDEHELGHLIRNDTHWDFLTLLATLRPKNFGFAVSNDGVLPANHLVNNRVPAENCRRELERALPRAVCRLFIRAAPGLGYKLDHSVELCGRGEAGLNYFENPEQFERSNEFVSYADADPENESELDECLNDSA